MYSKIFSRIYNEFGWNYYPEAFAGQLLTWLAANAPQAQRILDLGCGTGVLCRILREHGFTADGVDLSENMVAIAREADPEGRYDVGDMTVYEPEGRYDIVTCTGDAVNHLTDKAAVEKMFCKVYSYLEEGGVFIFDLLNETEVPDPDPIEFRYDEHTDASLQMTKDEAGIVTLKVRVKEDGENVLEEIVTERLYGTEIIRGLLENAGFTQIAFAHRLLEDGKDVPTWYVTAEKP